MSRKKQIPEEVQQPLKHYDVEISVIMPVYLGEYEGCGQNREIKFIRAVNSFLVQDFRSKELIIVSDGCDIAETLYNLTYKNNSEIRFFKMPKQELFSGAVRQKGIDEAKGRIISYLDSDDMLDTSHLSIIHKNFDVRENDWVYYNDFWYNGTVKVEHNVQPRYTVIGTSSISHLREINMQWQDGWGHDWKTISKYLMKLPHRKIETPQYIICHINNLFDV